MPEVEYTTQMRLPIERVWDFVKDMNNWAPFLTGYQGHEIVDETDSIWTLKGDVGPLARTVRLRAHVVEWNGPERVEFTLEGVNEPVGGGGVLEMKPGEAPALAQGSAPGLFRRFFTALFRMLFRWKHGMEQRALPAGEAGAQLTFRLWMEAGGPTGPVVNAMLGPLMGPAAEDLANKIANHLEAMDGR